ncbi:MAG: SDR family oxidoreductase [Actinobacteria bacterium]|nr:SDR family oxidoreductase [Actinomycetota bacterium]
MGQLDGKIAVITGGASGIGAGTARRFVEEGARVVLADIQAEAAADVAATFGNDVATSVRCDVSKEADVKAAIDHAVATWGAVDCLYNNAGFVGATGPFEDTTSDEYDITMNVLLRSVFYGIKHVSPIMKAQRSGSILSTASVCGLVPDIGTHLYNVAKAGVIMMTKTAALEFAEWNVRVNAICPGFIATQLTTNRPISEVSAEENGERMDKARERMSRAQPMHRMGETDDIANMAVFLASDASNWITGQAHVVDGGVTLGKPWRKQPAAITEHRGIGIYKPAD